MKRLIRVLLIAGFAASWAPPLVRSAAAQAGDPRFERAKAALPAIAARDLDRVVADARTQGLPTDPLIAKALEGTAKGVPADRIMAVVRQLADELGHARDLVGSHGSSPADITAVADALRRGVPSEAIQSLRNDTDDGESIALAVHTVADLLDRGVPVDQALDVLGAWRSRGARQDELRELPAAVERLIREGILPAQAAAAVASAVRGGHGPAGAVGPPGLTGSHGKGKGKGPPDRPPLPPGATPAGITKGKKSGG